MMTKELLPCPFCGGTKDENGIIDHDEKCFVYLLIDALMYGTGSKKKIEKAWNTRAERTCRIETKKFPLSSIPMCSECGRFWLDKDSDNYCPRCGAKVVER